METKTIILAVVGILVGIPLILGMFAWGTYNGLIAAEMEVNGAWAEVEVQYQRRFDLIPNLVETTKGYVAYEKELLVEVTALRSQWGAALASQSPSAVNDADASFGQTFSRLMMVANPEAYPELQGIQMFQDLNANLEGTENRIAVARSRYNKAVINYNKAIRYFPANILAGMFGFTSRDTFDAAVGASDAVVVDFG